MSAPDLNKARLTVCSSSRVIAGADSARSDEPPPDQGRERYRRGLPTLRCGECITRPRGVRRPVRDALFPRSRFWRRPPRTHIAWRRGQNSFRANDLQSRAPSQRRKLRAPNTMTRPSCAPVKRGRHTMPQLGRFNRRVEHPPRDRARGLKFMAPSLAYEIRRIGRSRS